METNANTETKKTAKRKRAGKPAAKKRVARKPVNRGGGAALSDFKNADKLRVLKPKEIARKGFRTGQTVAQNLAAQKKAGYRGRRKYIRKQIAMKRVALIKVRASAAN